MRIALGVVWLWLPPVVLALYIVGPEAKHIGLIPSLALLIILTASVFRQDDSRATQRISSAVFAMTLGAATAAVVFVLWYFDSLPFTSSLYTAAAAAGVWAIGAAVAFAWPRRSHVSRREDRTRPAGDGVPGALPLRCATPPSTLRLFLRLLFGVMGSYAFLILVNVNVAAQGRFASEPTSQSAWAVIIWSAALVLLTALGCAILGREYVVTCLPHRARWLRFWYIGLTLTGLGLWLFQASRIAENARARAVLLW